MIIQNNNCIINNSQIGNNNKIINNSQIGNNNKIVNNVQEIDWKSWNLLCQELKNKMQNEQEILIVYELEQKINAKNEKGLKKFVKENYKDFFLDVLSGVISSNFADLIKKLLF